MDPSSPGTKVTDARLDRPPETRIPAAPVGIGIVGCGTISGNYLKSLSRFPHLRVVAVSDIVIDRARDRAREFSIPKACSPDELLADPDVELVVNLTVPAAHASVAMAAIEAGRSVYNEKPLAIDFDEGRRLVEAARERGLRVGGAPDTWLGAAIQQAREVIDTGRIGEPVGVIAAMVRGGPESWHPEPAFFYRRGGGPLLDVGPYHITTLLFLLGSVRRVSGTSRITFAERNVTGGPRKGEVVPVETPTYITGVLDFAAGPVGTLITSWDVVASDLPHIEVHGSEGSLSLPDPNHFQGILRIRRNGQESWEELPLSEGFADPGDRGIGPAELVEAMLAGRPHRASGELALHTLEIMSAILESSERGQAIDLTTSCERPEPLPTGWMREIWRTEPVPA